MAQVSRLRARHGTGAVIAAPHCAPPLACSSRQKSCSSGAPVAAGAAGVAPCPRPSLRPMRCSRSLRNLAAISWNTDSAGGVTGYMPIAKTACWIHRQTPSPRNPWPPTDGLPLQLPLGRSPVAVRLLPRTRDVILRAKRALRCRPTSNQHRGPASRAHAHRATLASLTPACSRSMASLAARAAATARSCAPPHGCAAAAAGVATVGLQAGT